MHLKVAQPRNVRLAPEQVVIGEARYVQWNRTRVERQADAAAVTITLHGGEPQTVSSASI
jgi:hypothetical protein